MKMNYETIGAVAIGTLLAAGTFGRCNEGAPQMESTTEVPATQKPQKIAGDADFKSEEQRRIEEQLRRWLEQSSVLIDAEDPCYDHIQSYMVAYSGGADRSKLRELKQEITKCGEENPQIQDTTRRNFAILESQTSYAKNCGDEQAQRCRKAQDEVAEYLEAQGHEGWAYSDEILWAYDERGEIIDAAAFPGYQKWMTHGDHDDVLSISVQWDTSGNAVYGLGISSQNEKGSEPVVWGRTYTSLEDLSEEINEMTTYSESPIASHD